MNSVHDAPTTLAPRLRALRTRTDAARRPPDEVVDALVEAQLFRVAVPEELGGPEVDPVAALEIYERLARIDAAVAWLVWNSSLPSLFGRFLPDSTRAEIFSDPSSKYACSTRPTGKAVREAGAFRTSGRWSLVSGCLHADWIALASMVHVDGEVEMIGPEVPHMRLMFVPTEEVTIVDTWDSTGLRGTGSHDVLLDDVVVPADRTFTPADASRLDRPIGRVPIVSTMAAGHAAICLGLASAALDEVRSLARSKVSVGASPGLAGRPSNQVTVARSGTRLAALRAELRRAVGKTWDTARSGAGRSLVDIAAVWSAAVTTGRACRSIVAELYEAAGSPAVYSTSPLDRSHRDIDAAMQHVVAQRFWLEEAGRVQFGLEPTNPLFSV